MNQLQALVKPSTSRKTAIYPPFWCLYVHVPIMEIQFGSMSYSVMITYLSQLLHLLLEVFFLNVVQSEINGIYVLLLLPLQNSDGGFATYELTRSYSWLEVVFMYCLCFYELVDFTRKLRSWNP